MSTLTAEQRGELAQLQQDVTNTSVRQNLKDPHEEFSCCGPSCMSFRTSNL